MKCFISKGKCIRLYFRASCDHRCCNSSPHAKHVLFNVIRHNWEFWSLHVHPFMRYSELWWLMSNPCTSARHPFSAPLPSQAQCISEHSGFPHGITNSCFFSLILESQTHLGCLNSTSASSLNIPPHAILISEFKGRLS